MARNKKKARKAAEEESGSDEQEELTTPTNEPNDVQEEGEKPAAEGSDKEGESDEDSPKKKKKEYRGNKLNKQKGKKGKKDNETAKQEEAKAEGSGSDSSDDEDDEGVTVRRQKPVEVLYCAICTFPAEMCEFSGMMEKCRPWLQEHAAELANAEERGRKRRILTEKDRLEALMEGRGIKKALERVVVIDVEKRTARRMITSVFGMDLFGFNMKDLSRDWRKQFACGVGVRAAEEGKHQDCLDIQGDVKERLATMLVEKYKIPQNAIFEMVKKKKVPYDFA